MFNTINDRSSLQSFESLVQWFWLHFYHISSHQKLVSQPHEIIERKQIRKSL
jgi:hypothetical protein